MFPIPINDPLHVGNATTIITEAEIERACLPHPCSLRRPTKAIAENMGARRHARLIGQPWRIPSQDMFVRLEIGRFRRTSKSAWLRVLMSSRLGWREHLRVRRNPSARCLYYIKTYAELCELLTLIFRQMWCAANVVCSHLLCQKVEIRLPCFMVK